MLYTKGLGFNATTDSEGFVQWPNNISFATATMSDQTSTSGLGDGKWYYELVVKQNAGDTRMGYPQVK